MIEAKTLIDRFESYCPQWLSEKGDVSGLQIGSLNKKIQRVMVSLDVRPNVVAEAIEKKVDLLLVKHAPIFRPIQDITDETPQSKMFLDLIRHDIAVYVAHTNMDTVTDGLNDWFCELLEVKETVPLIPTHRIGYKKLVVYVPKAAAENLRQVLADAGAGQQGNYRGTSYSLSGTGRFTPVAGADPAIGKIGQPEQVLEERIEVLYLETQETTIIQAMLAHHPYEEPAYDILTLANPPKVYGIGRVGELSEALPVEVFIQKVKEVFALEGLRVVYPRQTKTQIKRVAICGGSGEKFYKEALKNHADVYITGDISYHTAHDMQESGMLVIDPGHYIESLSKERLVKKLQAWQQSENWDVEITASQVSTNPFSFK